MQKTKLVVLGLIENQNHEFLISQRYDPEVPAAHLKWDLIGGTNEFGESLEITLEREILEESGLKVEVLEMMPKSFSKVWQHNEYDIHVVVFCYYCKYLSGETNLDDPKINDLKWVPVTELNNYEFLPSTQCFIDVLLKRCS